VIFEGRDTAGKGGVIKRITERCSPRVFKHVALPAPSDREKSQLYIQGKVVFEKEFAGDFAADLPWHKYPSVASLSDEDKQKLAALVKERADAFKPKFEAIYRILGTKPEVQVAEIRKIGCLEKAHAAGVRVPVPATSELEFATTGSAAVVVARKAGWLYPFDEKTFARVKGEQVQMCAGIALSIAYPPRLVVARAPDGRWEVVY